MEWLFDKLGPRVQTELTDFCRKTNFFDEHAVSQLLAARNSASSWYLLNVALWWKQFVEQAEDRQPLAA
jgi:hypothetical protein